MNCRQSYVEDPATRTIRVTASGLAQYRERLARLGIDMKTIRTKAELGRALETACEDDLRKLAANARGQDPELDRIMAGLPGWD